jgi:hypothetical protein
MKSLITIFIFITALSGAVAQHDHSAASHSKDQAAAVAFKDAKLGAAYEHYTHLKEALVASKSDEASKASEELKNALKNVKGAASALTTATKLAAAKNIEEQRLLFSAMSDQMASLVKGGQLSSGLLYLEYCPMANNNEGAYWLSNEKQIRNPYFGDAMLKCGSVKETIQ